MLHCQLFQKPKREKIPFLSTVIALGSSSQQFQIITIAPTFENKLLFKHRYLLWLASWSHSKSKGRSSSPAKSCSKPLNPARALLLVPLLVWLQCPGPAEGFAENAANNLRPRKCLVFGPGMGNSSEDPNQALRTHQARCKSFLLCQAFSGRSTDKSSPNSLLVTMLLLSETFIASHWTSVPCC